MCVCVCVRVCVCVTDIFKTDTEISRTNGSGYSKELQVCVVWCGVVWCDIVCG